MSTTLAATPLMPPPGPRGLPVLGSLHRLVGTEPPQVSISRLARRHGDICLLRVGGLPTVVLTHPDAMAEAFDRDELSNHRAMVPHSLLSAQPGLIFSTFPERWRSLNRLAVEHLFSTGSVAAPSRAHLGPAVDDAVERIAAASGAAEPEPVGDLLFSSAFDLTFRALFGADDTGAAEHQQMRDELRENLAWTVTACSAPAYGLVDVLPRLRWMLDWILNRWRAQTRRRDSLIGRLVDHAEKRRSPGTADPACLVDVMLDREASGELSRPATVAMCMDTLVNAPTVAAAVSWILLLTANRPDVQTAVQQELDRVVGPDAPVGEDHAEQLPFTFACIAESLRYRTVTPMTLPHLAAEDTQIGGYRVRAGTQVLGAIHSVHHDERFWESPDEFLPERFLPDSDGSPPDALTSGAYLPFGVGRRRCAGDRFALAAILLYAARTLHRLRLDPLPGDRPSEQEVFGLFVTPRPYALRATPRAAGGTASR